MAADGEVGFLDGVTRRFGPWIRGRLRASYPREVDDLAQEVMLRIVQHRPRVEAAAAKPDQAALGALIGRIVRSVLIDEHRRRARRSPGVALEETLLEAPGGGAGPAGAEEHGLGRALGALTSAQREILALRFEEDLGFREIGEVMGIPTGTVTGWYSRALKALREILR